MYLILDIFFIRAVLVHVLKKFVSFVVQLGDEIIEVFNVTNQLVHTSAEFLMLGSENFLLLEEGASDTTAATAQFLLLL